MSVKLYAHQKLACQYLRTFDGFALFHDKGLGKTLPVLIRILELRQQGLIEDALVVAPKAALGAWTRDAEKWFTESEAALLLKTIHLINYESVWRPNKGYDRHWDLIVLDESHRIKNRSANVTKFLLHLALSAKYRYILTGTPVGNGQLENIWSQLAFLYPEKKGRTVSSRILGTYKHFLNRHCVLNQFWQPYRYLNVSELQDKIAAYSHRVTKEEALDLPEKLPDQILDIELQEKEIYRELRDTSVISRFNLLVGIPLVKLNKLRQLASGFLILEYGGTHSLTHSLRCEKLQVLKEVLEGHQGKLVIFANFQKSIEDISALLDKEKITYVRLDGQQKNKLIWKDFQADRRIKVIVCQYQSAAMGIDLFAADTILYYEPTLSSNVLEQSRDRRHRVGQKRPCSYIHLLTKGTVEKSIFNALARHQDFSERLFTEYVEQYQRGRK